MSLVMMLVIPADAITLEEFLLGEGSGLGIDVTESNITSYYGGDDIIPSMARAILEEEGRTNYIASRVQPDEDFWCDTEHTSPDKSVSVSGSEVSTSVSRFSTLSTGGSYNNSISPSANNLIKQPQIPSRGGFSEYVSPYSGELTLNFQDVSLKSRNNSYFNLNRVYQTNQAVLGDKYAYQEGSTWYEGFTNSTYLHDRYALGLGWSFGFPSVEVRGTDDASKELFYHNGSGNVYKVNFSSTSSNLENYYSEDIRFHSGSANLPNCKYYVKSIDGTIQYFGSDGSLMMIADRFGNNTEFEYIWRPVSNIVPNGMFEYSENIGIWQRENSYMNYDSSGIMKFSNISTVRQSSKAVSDFIKVDADTEYDFRGWYVADASIGNSRFSGTVKIKILSYDENKQPINNSNWMVLDTNDFTGDITTWCKETAQFNTNYTTEYVKISLEVDYGKGEMAFDHICLDKSRNQISKITDSTGRTMTFNYGNYLYDRDLGDENPLTITLSSSGTETRVFTYERKREFYTFIRKTPLGTYTEDVCFWILGKYREQNIIKQSYSYEPTVSLQEYFSFFHEDKMSDDSYYTSRPYMTSLQMNNTKTTYGYSPATKKLGDSGYYETQRISNRYDSYSKLGTNGIWMWYGQLNKINYTYTGNLDENLKTNVTTDNGFSTEYQFDDSKYSYIITSGDGKTVDTRYTNDLIIKDKPKEIYTEITQLGEPTIETYKYFEYDLYGSVISETLPMTPAEKVNKAKFKKIYNYSYTPFGIFIERFIDSTTWYNDKAKPAVTNSMQYDASGRLSKFTDTKGQEQVYTYEYGPDDLYTWLPTHVKQFDINNTHNLLNYNSIVNYSKWNNGIYPGIIMEDSEDESCYKSYVYSFLYDVLTDAGNENNEFMYYNYDNFGRVVNTYSPALKNENGNFIFNKTEYVYDSTAVCEEYDNINLYRIDEYNCTVDDFAWTAFIDTNRKVIQHTVKWYDDFGKIMLSGIEDENGNIIYEKYEYDNYGNIEKQTDLSGNYKTYTYDCFGRKRTSSDRNNNTAYYDYGTDNIKTYFRGNGGTGAEENHTLQYFDVRGMTTSSSIYPDGWNGTPITSYYIHDLAGNVTSFTDGRGNATTYEYDELNQLVKTHLPGFSSNQYYTNGYNKNGSPTFSKQYDGNNGNSKTNTNAILYDSRYLPFYRQDSTTEFNAAETYTYTKTKQLYTKTDRKGILTSFDYDNMDNLITSTTPNDTIGFYYSSFGNVAKYEYTGHETLTKENNHYGRIEERYQGSYNTSFQYNILGNITKMTDPFNLVTDYDYDTLNRLETVTTDGITAEYDYYDDNMLKTVSYGGMITTYTYDNANRMYSMVTKRGNTVIRSEIYSYDGNNNVTTIQGENGTKSYDYDPTNRLTCETDGSRTIVYSYDAYGNRDAITINGTLTDYDYDGVNRLKSVGNTQYSYDRNGNLISDGESTYEYDDRNKLVSYTKNGVTTNYTYNAEGLRIAKNDFRYHLDNNGNVIAESNSTGVQSQTMLGHKPLGKKIDGTWYYYIYNAHGDVVNMVDSNGNVLRNFTYDAWGNPVNQNTSSTLNRAVAQEVAEPAATPTSTPAPSPTPEPAPASRQTIQTMMDADYVLQEEGKVYISDMDWISSTNGWGPVERDMNNKEWPANDGNTITINGVQYQKGIGCHTISEVQVAINRQYDLFETVIGVDDYTPSGYGMVIFKVYGDDVLLYESPIMTGSDDGLPISIDVSNVNVLKLVADNTANYNHADWADAKLTPKPATIEPLLDNVRYAGEYYDAESGLVYLRNRYYCPSTGRFTQEDPMRDGLNWYQYAGNNPVMYMDSWGLYDETILNRLLTCIRISTGEITVTLANGYIVSADAAHIAANNARNDLKSNTQYVELWDPDTELYKLISQIVSDEAYENGNSKEAVDRALLLTKEYWDDYYRKQGFNEFIDTALIAGAVLLVAKGGLSAGATGISIGTNLGKLGTLVENPGIKVIWSSATSHALSRMTERGVTNEMVENWVANGKALQQAGDKLAFITRDGVAVVTNAGKLITAYGKDYFDPAMQKLVEMLFK